MSVPRKKNRLPHRDGAAAPPPPVPTPHATVAAAVFKAQCLSLMDRVDRTGEEIVITKHNRPVAKLVRVRMPDQPRRFFGRSQGRIHLVGDLLAPINADWHVEEDL